MKELTAYTKLSIEEMQEHSTLLINALDKDSKVVFWNRRCEEYFSISKDNAIGKRFEELFPQFKDDGRMNSIKRALDGHQQLRIDRYTKSSRYYKQRLIPVRDEEGNIVAALNIVEDILK